MWYVARIFPSHLWPWRPHIGDGELSSQWYLWMNIQICVCWWSARENMSAIRRAVEEEAVAHDMLFSKLLGDLQIICKKVEKPQVFCRLTLNHLNRHDPRQTYVSCAKRFCAGFTFHSQNYHVLGNSKTWKLIYREHFLKHFKWH